MPGIRIENDVCLNQVALSFGRSADDPEAGRLTRDVAEALNTAGRFFVRTAEWRGRTILRLSVSAGATDRDTAALLAAAIEAAWRNVAGEALDERGPGRPDDGDLVGTAPPS